MSILSLFRYERCRNFSMLITDEMSDSFYRVDALKTEKGWNWYWYRFALLTIYLTFLAATPITISAINQLPVKLTATNFASWKAQFDALLFCLDLSGYVDGSFPSPTKTIESDDKFSTSLFLLFAASLKEPTCHYVFCIVSYYSFYLVCYDIP